MDTARLMRYVATVSKTFGHGMLMNYLVHGYNISRKPEYGAPLDAITALFRDTLKINDEDVLDNIHASSHVMAGIYGVIQLLLQLQSLVSGGSSTATQPKPTLSGI